MKTAETVALEKSIRRATRKTGVFGCYEVTIGFCGRERVDYMTYDTKGVFRCYEIKVSKADFHSAAAKSFVGHYNYYVLTRELYNQVKEEIPDWIGVYIGDYCAKKAKKQDLSGREYKMRRSVNGRSTEVSTPWVDMLKESMIRSLYRDSDKLIQTEDEQYIGRLRAKIDDESSLSYFVITDSIPFIITSVFVTPCSEQYRSIRSLSSFDIRQRMTIFFGLSAFGLPVRGDIQRTSFYCSHNKYYRDVATKNQ